VNRSPRSPSQPLSTPADPLVGCSKVRGLLSLAVMVRREHAGVRPMGRVECFLRTLYRPPPGS